MTSLQEVFTLYPMSYHGFKYYIIIHFINQNCSFTYCFSYLYNATVRNLSVTSTITHVRSSMDKAY